MCLAPTAVPGGAGLLEALGALVDASLIFREVTAEGSEEAYRFRMLQTIREAALERLLTRGAHRPPGAVTPGTSPRSPSSCCPS